MLSALTLERDGAAAALTKLKSDHASLRRRLLEDEEGATGREAQLVQAAEDLRAQVERARADTAEEQRKAEDASRRIADLEVQLTEREAALDNLNALLESYVGLGDNAVVRDAIEDEAEQLRVSGKLLLTELASAEATTRAAVQHEMEACRRAQAELAEAREALQAAQMEVEAARLQRVEIENQAGAPAPSLDGSADPSGGVAMRGGSSSKEKGADGAPSAADDTERALMAQLLVRLWSQGNVGGELAVLASMLGCSAEQRGALGLMRGPDPTAKEVGDMWVQFLESESAR